MVLLVEAAKLMLRQPITVYTPHTVLSVLEQKWGHWLTSASLQSYQAQLQGIPGVCLKTCSILNPATLLPEEGEEISHSCQEVIEYSSREGLSAIPLTNQLVIFTDGSSFVENGQRKAGYAVITLFETLEAEPLALGTSAQAVELWALTGALQLSQGQKVNIFMDSKFAFCCLHIFGVIWKSRATRGKRRGHQARDPRAAGSCT